MTFFTILTQIGGILGLSKVFVLAFLYNERVFEGKLRKRYESVGAGRAHLKSEERYAKVLNESTGVNQDTTSALVEGEVAEEV